MTTSLSPLSAIKKQSDAIAKTLKQAERGEHVASDPTGKIAASIAAGLFQVGIVMDDKVITIDMPWATIREYSEVALSEYILKLMKGARDQ